MFALAGMAASFIHPLQQSMSSTFSRVLNPFESSSRLYMHHMLPNVAETNRKFGLSAFLAIILEHKMSRNQMPAA